MIPNDAKAATPAQEPYFIIGEEFADRSAGPTVAIAVSVNFDLIDGNRRRGHAIPLHEVPMLRRLYANGEFKLLTSWVPAVDRRRTLTQGQFTDEMKRLAESYVIPSPKRDLFAEVYGTTPSDQMLKLHAGMRAIYEGWTALWAEALKRLAATGRAGVHPHMLHQLVGEVISVEEIERLVSLVEPLPSALASIKLDAINIQQDPATNAPAETTGEGQSGSTASDPMTRLIAGLEADGLDNQTAMEAATLAIELPDLTSEELGTQLAQLKGLQKADGSGNKTKVRVALATIEKHRQNLTAPV